MSQSDLPDRLGESGATAPDSRERLNVGHGIVVPRPDGRRHGCGGPAACPQCRRDQNLIDALSAAEGEDLAEPAWAREFASWGEGHGGRDPDARVLVGAPPRVAALLVEHARVREHAVDPDAHPFDPGHAAQADRCRALVLAADGFVDECGETREAGRHGREAGHAFERGSGDLCARPGCGQALDHPAHGGTLRAALAIVQREKDGAEDSWASDVAAGRASADDVERASLLDGLRLALAALAGRSRDWEPAPRTRRPELRMPSLADDGDRPTLVADDGTRYGRAIFGPEGALVAWRADDGAFVSWASAEALAAAVLRAEERADRAEKSNETRESGPDADRLRRATALRDLAADDGVDDAAFRARVLRSAARAVEQAAEADRAARLAALREQVLGD